MLVQLILFDKQDHQNVQRALFWIFYLINVAVTLKYL